MGKKFHDEIDRIKDARLRNGNSKNRDTTESMTNLIIRNKNWRETAQQIIEASSEEVKSYG